MGQSYIFDSLSMYPFLLQYRNEEWGAKVKGSGGAIEQSPPE